MRPPTDGASSIMHGDKFDGIVKYARWLAILGDQAYNLLLAVNHWYNLWRRKFGYPYWSLSSYLKRRVKDAVSYIDDFEVALADEARRRGVDGVICGHIHKAEIREFGSILYCNDGDWVESCTALVEHPDGRLEILEWASLRSFSMLSLARPRPRADAHRHCFGRLAAAGERRRAHADAHGGGAEPARP